MERVIGLPICLDHAFRRVSGVGDDVPQLPNFLKVFQESVRENVVGWYKTKPLFAAFLVPGASYYGGAMLYERCF